MEVFQGGPVQQMNHSSSQTSYHCPEPKSLSGCSPCLCKLQAAAHHSAFHCVLMAEFLHLSHLSISYSFVIMSLRTAMCHTVCVCMLKQLCIHIFIAMSHGSDSGVLVSEVSLNTGLSKTCLRYPVADQSQSVISTTPTRHYC